MAVANISFHLVNYFDVWGNKKDGWEVNNLCIDNIITLPENATKKDYIKALKEIGFFKKHVRENMLDIWDDGEMIEFSQKSNGKPLCRLEMIR